MRWSVRTLWLAGAALALGLVPRADAEVLTVDRAVQLALANSSSMVQAQSHVVNARSGVYSAYSFVLPSLSAQLSRSGSQSITSAGSGIRPLVPPVGSFFFSSTARTESYSTSPTLSAQWDVLNLSSLQSLRSANTSLDAARLRLRAARAQVALDTWGLFYSVVKSEHLAVVTTEAARLAHDDERRVRALFEVGSVSKSDLLTAQVRTAQAQLDSLNQHLDVLNQRILLARQLGLREAEMPEVDTVLTAQAREYDEAELQAEARRSRPDIQAVESEFRAARSSLTAANLARLPFVTLSGSGTWNPTTGATQTFVLYDSTLRALGERPVSSTSKFDRELNGSVALTWNVFSGFRTESGIAQARAALLVAQDNRNIAVRNLEAEVHQALLQYREAVAALDVAERGLASAEENVRLTQQKYNVGSATILDLINAQVQLQQARSNQVSALAGIRLAEATLDRVRGRVP